MSSYYPQTLISESSSSGQIVFALGIVIIVFLLAYTSEILYVTTMNSRNRFQTLIPYTASSQDMTITIHQDPSQYMDAKPIGLSVNERTGIEFSYSFYLYVLPTTFDGSDTLKHVFHKGYPSAWPLMGPGVFMRGNTNTMRVIMNTYANPYTYVDIPNIPVQKWVHVVLNSYKGGLDIFINGNLANRISFKNTLPYQNFQEITVFSNATMPPMSPTIYQALGEQTLSMQGSLNGSISNLTYARYALSMNEIQNLMSAGPSSKVKTQATQLPPYMGDDWWTGGV